MRAVQVNYADYKSGRFADAPDIYTEFELQHSTDGQNWQPLAKPDGPRRDRPNAYIELPQPVRTRFVRYVHGHVGGANLAISDLRVFGNADGRAPSRAGARGRPTSPGPARCDDPLGQGAGRGRLQHPLRHQARPADA